MDMVNADVAGTILLGLPQVNREMFELKKWHSLPSLVDESWRKGSRFKPFNL